MRTGFDQTPPATTAPALDLADPKDIQSIIADVEQGFTAVQEFQSGMIINSPVIEGTFLGETVDVRVQIVRKPANVGQPVKPADAHGGIPTGS